MLWKKIRQSCCIPMNHHHHYHPATTCVHFDKMMALLSQVAKTLFSHAMHAVAQNCLGLPRIGFLLPKQVFSHSCMIASHYGVTIINVYVADWTKSSAIKHFPLEPNIPHLFTFPQALKSGRAIMQKRSQPGKDKAEKCMSLSFSKLYSSTINIQFKMI